MKQPHKTIKNFCCACEYDQLVFRDELELAKQKQRKDIIKMIEERISYGKKFRLNKKDNLRSGWTGIESGECCEKCKMRDEDFNGSADALKAIVGCRNPFQLKKTCECHLPFRKVAEESIQQALQLIKEKICNNGTPNK